MIGAGTCIMMFIAKDLSLPVGPGSESAEARTTITPGRPAKPKARRQAGPPTRDACVSVTRSSSSRTEAVPRPEKLEALRRGKAAKASPAAASR